MKSIVTIFIVVILSPLSSWGQTDQTDSSHLKSTRTNSPTVIVSIDQSLVEQQQLQSYYTDTLNVWLESDSPIAAFDFTIATTGEQFEIVDILAGDLCNSCNWEFFDSHPVSIDDKQSTVNSAWQVVALAQVLPDTARRACFSLGGKATLIKVIVSLNNRTTPGQSYLYTPLFFWWKDCTDNTISDQSGDSLWVSKSVIGFTEAEPSISNDLFPTSRGLPQACLRQDRANRPRRRIEFRNGGIGPKPIKFENKPVAPPDLVDSVSDTLADSLR